MIEEITSPPFLDDTAQEIVTKLQAIANNINNNAGQVSYSNTTSELQAETVQTAIDEVKGITDTISSSLTHNLMSYEDVTVVTGSTQYVGYYYGDGSITTSVSDKEIVSAFVYSATSNRPAFIQRIGATSVRAFCPVSDTTIVIRVLFKHN